METKVIGLVQTGEEKVSGGTSSSLPIPQGRLLRRKNRALRVMVLDRNINSNRGVSYLI